MALLAEISAFPICICEKLNCIYHTYEMHCWETDLQEAELREHFPPWLQFHKHNLFTESIVSIFRLYDLLMSFVSAEVPSLLGHLGRRITNNKLAKYRTKI